MNQSLCLKESSFAVRETPNNGIHDFEGEVVACHKEEIKFLK